jgi:hypothetical protein
MYQSYQKKKRDERCSERKDFVDGRIHEAQFINDQRVDDGNGKHA